MSVWTLLFFGQFLSLALSLSFILSCLKLCVCVKEFVASDITLIRDLSLMFI